MELMHRPFKRSEIDSARTSRMFHDLGEDRCRICGGRCAYEHCDCTHCNVPLMEWGA
jgi:hypothetical protein